MRNFFLILRKYNFFLVFLLLQGLSLYLLVKNNSYQREVTGSVANEAVGKVYTAYAQVTDYLTLGITNRLLAEENARLRTADSNSFYRMTVPSGKNVDTLLKQQYYYITAKVINNSVSKVNNYLTLDAGSLKGIEPDMPVISSNGVVGVVTDVSPHFCRVMSVLNSNTRISAKFSKNNYFGSAMWTGGTPSQGVLNDIPSHAPVRRGDTVVTTSYSKYPAGIMVGVVSDLGKGGVSFKDIKIRFSTDFQNISYVYIVKDLLRQERDSLEAKTPVSAESSNAR